MAMKKWSVTGVVHGGKFLGEVMAETEAEAKLLGEKLDTNYVSLCHQCAEQVEDPEIGEIVVSEV